MRNENGVGACDVRLDAVGTAHAAAGIEPRIVSLVPSLTELLCDLGLQKQIVGRTGFCIHPKSAVRPIPKVGGTKDVDVGKIRDLRPTHVIVNIDENRRELVDELAAFVDNIFVTHPQFPADNLRLYEDFGHLFHCQERSGELQREFAAACGEIESVARPESRRVLYLIWRDPWMTVGPDTYIARMLGLINWQTVPQHPEVRYPEIELSAYADAVDHVLLSSEPYPFRDRHIEEVRQCFAPGVGVSLVDGEMLSWYGSRAIAGVRYLATLDEKVIRSGPVSAPVESPCVDVCQIDQSHGVCRGCFRTLGEIAGWGTMSPAERRVIMRDLPSRKKNNPLS